ncbi:MAG: 3-isopropylmalate dehydratase large subunit [Clostridia bacterium]|nr:3-isopropylmalate dehydratase large subunit [Clostridia bacterium]
MYMAMTMTQKILAAHAGLESVRAGQLISAKLDLVLGNDVTAPVAIQEFQKFGFDKVFDTEKIALVMDHFTPNKDIKSAGNCKKVRAFAGEQKIKNFFDVGAMGIEHALLPEQGLVIPGDCAIGADSHTCTYGALGAFSTGVGSTDMAAGMAGGVAWFKVPSAIKVVLKGELPKNVSGKDVILYLIGKIGVDGALYRSLEFCGEGVAALSMDDRFAIANMAIECGAKNGIFPVDDKTLEYVNGRTERQPVVFEADNDAEYDETIEIDLSSLRPIVALPHLPSNTKFVDELGEKIYIDQCVIGSCTNGRMEDMRRAAAVLKGKKIASGVRLIVIPATQKIYLDCIREGLAEIFVEAGGVFSTPTCGPCLGGHMGVLAAGERAVSTTNRNFVGRMGDPTSEVILASPDVAAASAIKGYITVPEE